MTQPENPVPPRGARPQLFGAPSAARSRSSRHPDFEASILATIDGRQTRFASSSRKGSSFKRVLALGAIALVAAAAYVGFKLSAPRAEPPAEPALVATPAQAPRVQSVSPSASPVQVAASSGAAAIETVVAVAPASSAETSAAVVLGNIQQALERPEPAAASQVQPAPKAVVATKGTEPRPDVALRGEREPARAPAASAHAVDKPLAKPVSNSADTDAELLAAMLPHLKRSEAAQTSVAYQKRCGHLGGNAAAECRVKFCNGRQGTDPVCPAIERR